MVHLLSGRKWLRINSLVLLSRFPPFSPVLRLLEPPIHLTLRDFLTNSATPAATVICDHFPTGSISDQLQVTLANPLEAVVLFDLLGGVLRPAHHRWVLLECGHTMVLTKPTQSLTEHEFHAEGAYTVASIGNPPRHKLSRRLFYLA